METLFRGVFDAEWMAVIGVPEFSICLLFSLVVGAVIAACYMYRSRYTQSFVVTLALLPAMVCVVIMLVNGNIGAGVAVAGAFSLVRFRSTAGTAREIGMVFFAMGAGLICGTGYLGFALVFTLVICAMFMLYHRLGFGIEKRSACYKTVRVVIPEDLDYTGVFDDLFDKYLVSHELTNVKTTNMGSLFKLTYEVVMKDAAQEKELIDQLRCRNGNLEIMVSGTAFSDSNL